MFPSQLKQLTDSLGNVIWEAVPTILYAIFFALTDELMPILAKALAKLENWEFAQDLKDSVVYKIFVLQYFDMFG